MVMPSLSALLPYPTRQHLSNVRPLSQSKLFNKLNQKPALTLNDISLTKFTHIGFMFVILSASIKSGVKTFGLTRYHSIQPNQKTQKKTY